MSDPCVTIGIYRKGGSVMDTAYKPYTIDELVTTIYEDNYSHIDFMDNMGGEDCDCHIHTTLNTILKYWEGTNE